MRPSAAAVAALAILAAGCGGGDGKRLSRDEFTTKADAVCKAAVEQRRALRPPSAIADIPAFVDAVLPLIDETASSLRELRPPKQLDVRVNAVVDVLERERDALASLGRAAKANDGKGVAEFSSKASREDQRFRTLTRAMGLVGCANG